MQKNLKNNALNKRTIRMSRASKLKQISTNIFLEKVFNWLKIYKNDQIQTSYTLCGILYRYILLHK